MFNCQQILSVTLLSIALPLTTASAFAQQVPRPATSSQLSAGGNSTSTAVKCYGKGANGENLGSGKGAGSCHAFLSKAGCKNISGEHGGVQRCRD
ncbi:hypothetical protein Cylst_3661 [Cylindrospermum stagnale PCC 7417]|uniref:Integral membrane protein n=1 Tax=Cylindrospermum stagnale PCC 7417 TaxID=56107 RepID=K9WZJ0_9NOST|nr:hypothetical protein [Cylindrospermum stagnale]AFZ25785.1 hypothetical protein Cylst_3661 [Cylindrospermum stagnale PCC 7417]